MNIIALIDGSISDNGFWRVCEQYVNPMDMNPRSEADVKLCGVFVHEADAERYAKQRGRCSRLPVFYFDGMEGRLIQPSDQPCL